MILERVELLARPGAAIAFAQALDGSGIVLLSAGEGCHSVKAGRGVENPDKFILLLEWDSVEAHRAFMGSPDHSAFSQLIAPFVSGGSMEHFDMGQG